MSNRARRLKYVSYYDTAANRAENRNYSRAATDKMDYIIGVMNRLGFVVDVISASQTTNRTSCSGKVVSLGGENTLRLFHSLPWGGKARRISSVIYTRAALLLWLLRHTERGEGVIVYHSLGYASVIRLAHLMRGFRLILEVEEVYGDVTGKDRDLRAEQRLFRRADAFILPTTLLGRAVNDANRPQVIVHGRYASEPSRGMSFADGRVHVVYAGTFDPRKGGALAATTTAEFLDRQYHLHILGSGAQADIQTLTDCISAVAPKTECRLTYDGLLEGDDYVDFLQTCHIGLSTQRRHADFSETSFPSKILSYLSNGLHVVSVRLRAVEESGVGDLPEYYDEDTPQAIAEAIMAIDPSQPYDSRQRLHELDMVFEQALRDLLG